MEFPTVMIFMGSPAERWGAMVKNSIDSKRYLKDILKIPLTSDIFPAEFLNLGFMPYAIFYLTGLKGSFNRDSINLDIFLWDDFS